MLEFIVLLLVGFVIIAPIVNEAVKAKNVRYEIDFDEDIVDRR